MIRENCARCDQLYEQLQESAAQLMIEKARGDRLAAALASMNGKLDAAIEKLHDAEESVRHARDAR